MKRVFIIAIISTLLNSSPAKANGKEFFLSVIYGTLAGTLVGAATLAFTSNPGDNLNNVARGASYGLYAGILLGLYVTYGMGEDTVDPRYPPPPSSKILRETSDFKISLAPYVLPERNSKDVTVGAQLFNYRF